MIEVEAIQRSRGVAILTGGEFVPISQWIGADGSDCEEQCAVVAVAGPDVAGKWWTINLQEYQPVFSH